jgi:hypothetical protein
LAGYSGTPLAKKLGIRPGFSLALVNPPDGFVDLLSDLPADVKPTTSLRTRSPINIIILFTVRRTDLEKRFARASGRLSAEPGSGLWIAWPKKSSGVPTDITEDTLREVGLPSGLVDNKVCAIDDTWSGLRFVHRRA